MRHRRFALALLLATSTAFALPPHSPFPGGIAVLDAGPARLPPPKATWGDQALAVIRDRERWVALLGIPLETLPGELAITIAGTPHQVAIQPRNYPEQRLHIRNQRQVEPNAEDLARIEREQAVTDAVKRHFSATLPPTDFLLPAAGPLSSRFGLRRIFNGQPRNPHAGLDVAVGTGTPVRAPADGIIANTGNYFFNGNTVFVDHGQGLVTAYMHLSRIDAIPGQSIKQGEILGAVGSTGRATGPHLHWAVILNNTPVDPELFLARP